MLFGYGVDKRVIYGLLIVLAVVSLASMSSQELFRLLITLPTVIIAVSLHEFAHANAADKLGDTTPRSQGRLTLNPIAHLDPFGFILMMFAHIGWGKPVQINPNNFNSNKSRGFCESMVALAGPLMNFFIALVSCIAYVVLYEVIRPNFVTSSIGGITQYFLLMLVTVDIGLGVFNLIPLPPLDGEKIFRNVISYNVREWLDRNYYTLYVVFMILWFFGFLEILVLPIINYLTEGLFWIIESIVSFIL